MVRNYTGAGLDKEQLLRIVRTASRSPSAGFSQGQSFVVVTDPETKSQVAAVAGEPRYVERGFDPWVSRAGALVVCCTSEAAYRSRYREPDKLRSGGGEAEWPVPWWFVDAGCSTMLLLLAAVDGGLAAGFLGLSPRATDRLRGLLGIPTQVTPIGIVTVGHFAPDRKSGSLRRGRKAEEEVIRWERW